MTRFIIPLVLVGSAFSLFTLYTNPQYQEIKTLSAQNSSYEDALTKATELRKLRDSLSSKRNTFSVEDVSKLEHMLPDNVDNIRLVIDVNNIAARHSLALSNVQLGDVSDARNSRQAAAVGSSGDPVGSVEIGFSVSANYDGFLAFLQDLEHSLRIVDVEKITFHADKGDLSTFDVRIRTYWLH